jgi:signal transduction histidine kinase
LEIEAGIVPTHDPAPKLDRLTEAPRKKKEIARLNKIADTLAEQLGELRRAIHDLEK